MVVFLLAGCEQLAVQRREPLQPIGPFLEHVLAVGPLLVEPSTSAVGEDGFELTEMYPKLNAELQHAVAELPGFAEVVTIESSQQKDLLDQAAKKDADWLLTMRLTKALLRLSRSGSFSELSYSIPFLLPLWGLAPDETYECSYTLRLQLVSVASGKPLLPEGEISGSDEQALNDWQRGWTLEPIYHELVFPWPAHAPTIMEACEPRARQRLLFELEGFLRNTLPRHANDPSFDIGQRATHAVVVGVNAPRLQGHQLKFAARDAHEFYRWLTAEHGGAVPSRNVALLLNTEASRHEIQRQMRRLREKASAGDRLIVFFAGFGGAANTRDGRRDAFLIPADLSSTNIGEGAISLTELCDQLRRDAADCEAVVLIDASFAGDRPGRTLSIGDKPVGGDLQSILRPDDKHLLWLASQPGEAAFESPEDGHGVFTNALLTGLGGTANTDGDDRIDLVELRSFVGRQLAERSAVIATEAQIPALDNPGDPRMNLGVR
ncbi:MAG: caspase family protein [Planctomycetota bacterium]